MQVEAQAGDLLIAETAARQHGVVARNQLLALGYSRNQVQGRLGCGRLHQLHRGVYAVGHTRLTQRGRWMAAVLACGPKALLSHRGAAALWGIVRPPGSSPDVLVVGCRARRTGLRIHLTRRLDRGDRATRDGIPLTSLPRTLIDLATILDRARLARAIEESDRLGLFDLRAVEELLERSARQPGGRALRLALSLYQEPAMTQSELERRFLQVLRDAGLPVPSVNAFVAGHQVDVLWRQERFAVELDGFEFHRTRAAFERDRQRDEELRLAGYEVVRLTWRRLEGEPQAVGRRIRAHLARRRRVLEAIRSREA